MHTDDTIAAISTPAGQGGIGIVRLSGKDAISIAEIIFRSLVPNLARDFDIENATTIAAGLLEFSLNIGADFLGLAHWYSF